MWKPPPKLLQLPQNEIHLWQAPLSAPPQEMARYTASLSEDEQTRANRFKFEADRQKFTVGRGILRHILSRYLNIPPSEIEFVYGYQQKPALKDNPANLQFNLSHSGQMALYAFTLHREIGVDIEQVRPLDDMEMIARRFFSAAEVAHFLSLPPSQRAQGFFNCWTRKEAYLKARGDGIAAAVPLNSFDVTLIPGQPAKLLQIRPFPQEVERWQLHSFDIEPNYVAAVMVETQPAALSFKHFKFK